MDWVDWSAVERVGLLAIIALVPAGLSLVPGLWPPPVCTHANVPLACVSAQDVIFFFGYPAYCLGLGIWCAGNPRRPRLSALGAAIVGPWLPPAAARGMSKARHCCWRSRQ